MSFNFDLAQSKLEKFKQTHLLSQFNTLDKTEQLSLLKDIESLDLEFYQDLLKKVDEGFATPSGLKPVECTDLEAASFGERSHWKSLGEKAIAEKKVGAFLLAGGQGSRLGFEGPKGQFKIGLNSGASLFELQAKRIDALAKKHNSKIHWFIMTSAQNDQQTRDFFAENDYWGLDKEEVFFFEQGLIPAISFDGKVLLESPSKVNRVPDGNGGCFKAFGSSGALAKAQSLGIEHLFVYGVDNALVFPCDPTFVGFHIDKKVPTSSKVVAKSNPHEAVGIFVNSDQGPGVIEYSDLDKDLAELVDDQGKLVYRGANIATHLFTIEALASAANDPLPYHVARKKVPYIDELGQEIKPSEANAYKFEQFLFDIFPRLEKMALLEVSRESEFAPVKNAEGKDSPASALKYLIDRDALWLKAANYNLEANKSYEISPYFSLDGSFSSKPDLKEAIAKQWIFEK